MKYYEWKEMEEIFKLLEAEGMNPRWCDTPVKFYDNGVKAGIPTDSDPRNGEEVIHEIAGQISVARQWYAVYRPLVDCKVLSEGSYEDFTEWVKRIVPSHPHLPKAVEMQRMYDKSFRSAVVLWDKKNAPVQGKRFDEYRKIAEEVRKRLS